jgi:hypothetical protein
MRDPVVINLALLANSCSASVEKILSWMVRKNNTVLAVNNKTPKTRRGRKKTKPNGHEMDGTEKTGGLSPPPSAPRKLLRELLQMSG